MSGRSYSRENVETHYGSDRPAVNIKVYGDLSDGFQDFRKYEPVSIYGSRSRRVRRNVNAYGLSGGNLKRKRFASLEGWIYYIIINAALIELALHFPRW